MRRAFIFFQQFLPHLSSPEERVFIVLNRDGDFAIVKGRWNGFMMRVAGDKTHKGKPGAAGALNVELFNLLRNTVQKLQLPGADGSTLFLIGGNRLFSRQRFEYFFRRTSSSERPTHALSFHANGGASCVHIRHRHTVHPLQPR